MRIARTARFKNAWRQLTKEDKALARKAVTNLLMNIRYPSLRAKKIQGAENIWEARVSRSVRLTFHILGDTIVLRNIGHHDKTLDKP